VQILCNLRNVKSFLCVFPSDILPHLISRSDTVIINAAPHTEKGSHWLAIHFEAKTSSAYYFDSYGISSLVPTIVAFLKRNCTVRFYNTVQLQGLTSTVCGQYCCLFALYMDRGYTPKQFVGRFSANIADWQIKKLFSFEFGPLRKIPRGGQCSLSINQKVSTNDYFVIFNSYVNRYGGSHGLRVSDRGEWRNRR